MRLSICEQAWLSEIVSLGGASAAASASPQQGVCNPCPTYHTISPLLCQYLGEELFI